MHTEKEARTKWCPFARYLTAIYIDRRPVTAAGVNQGPNERGELVRSNCIASECMAWRWIGDDWEPGEQIWEQGGGSYTTERPPKPRGYCGLAGQHDD